MVGSITNSLIGPDALSGNNPFCCPGRNFSILPAMTYSKLKFIGFVLTAMFAFSCPLTQPAVASAVAKKTSMQKKPGKGKPTPRASKEDSPDFAFPQTVIDNAEVALRKASATHDETVMIQSAIQIVMANNLISTDRMPAMASMLDSLAQASSPAGAAILYSLEAQLYQQVYHSARYQYDQRTLPLGSYPEDPQQWSGQLFALKVLELTDKSLANGNLLREIPSSAWTALLTNTSGHGLDFYPTLYSILANRGIALLATFTDNETVIPFGSETQKADPSQRCAQRMKGIADEWYAAAVASGNVAEISEAMDETLTDKSPADRFAANMQAYANYKGSPYATEFLISADYDIDDMDDAESQYYDLRNKLVKALEECVETHPDYFRVNKAKSILNDLKAGSGALRLKSVYSTAMNVNVEAIASRMPADTYACLYKLPANSRGIDYKTLLHSPQTKFISSRKIISGQEEADTCMLDFGKLPAGQYILAANKAADGARKSLYSDYCVFQVSDLALSVVNAADKNYLLVTGTTDGKPCEGLNVKFTRERSATTVNATTDNNGLAPFPANWDRVSVEAQVRRGEDVQTLSKWIYRNTPSREPSADALVLTDLALYHPGDTCRFTAIAYERDNRNLKRSPLSGTQLRAILFNTSYTPCDTLDITSGRDGRATGSFVLPKDGMNGICIIRIYQGDNTERQIGIASVRVEQYKQPSFFVELDKVQNIVPGDMLTVNGKATTYSGMPVSGAAVKVNIETMSLWWFNDLHGSYSADTTTDSEGRFTLSLSTDRLADTDFKNQYYRIQAAATSESGESQQSEYISFYIGFEVKIRYSGPKDLCGDTDTLKLPFSVIGGQGERQPLDYKIESLDGAVVLSGQSPTSTLELSAATLPSGTYTIEVNAAGTKCDETVTVYRASDTVPPLSTALWVPESGITVPAGASTVEVPVGSSRANYIFYMVSDPDGIVDKGFIRPEGKIEKLKATAPASRNERVWVTFCTVDSCETSSNTVTITPAIALEKVKVEKISFRDKINAGGEQRWTFRYTLADKGLTEIPVVATLTDKSLNAIYPFRWEALYEPYINRSVSITQRLNNYSQSLNLWHPYGKELKYPYIGIPDINTYGNDLYNRYGNIRIRGAYTMANATTKRAPEPDAAPLYAMSEKVEYDEVVVVGYGTVTKESLTGSVAIVNEEEMADEGGAGGTAQEQSVKYRPAEMPVAWFKPSLSTDSEGVLEISFTAPDFNTTWQLQMLGYDKDMLSALTVEDVVASKPVMVSTNSPRFLRTGDQVTLMATVYNNTDHEADLSARMEIYDPLTGNTLTLKDFSPAKVSAMGSRVVALEFRAPADLEFVAYRVYGSADGFSDGEQSLVAIVPSSTPVTESWPFYMAPASESRSLTLPKLDPEAQVYFQYCDNPVWECVTALPDMTSDPDASILSVADNMYGNAIAAGLVRRYPQLGQAIKTWSEEGDSTLVSKLQRDSELKTVALEKTPWVLNAQAETLRMGGLTNLLDSDNCKKTLGQAMKRLVTEQKDGGWSWCEGMEPSMYITAQVLWRLGMLSHMGYLPQADRVQGMIESALRFCDKELYRDYVRLDRQFSTTQMLDYLYIRSFFPSVAMSSEFSTLKRKAIAAVKDEWKGFGIYHKATAATLLSREKQPMLARTILESLNQYASKSEERGMWFDNLRSGFFSEGTLITTAQTLEAFSEITPQAPAVDQLRQWLIIERQAQDWGRDAQLAEVVYAILSTGSDWTVSSEPARFFLGDKELTPGRRDRLTGSFTMPLTAAEASGATLHVEKSGTHQSWGGVLARYIAPIRDVKDFSESDVTVRKRILVVEQGKDGTAVRPIAEGETLGLGQRIRVQLTVTSERDIDYAVITDGRGGCMAPVDQLSHYVWQDGTGFYREVRQESTNFFLPRLPKGDFILEYDCFAGQEGTFSIGIATLQSLYAPTLSAHSAGDIISIVKQ